MKSGRLQLQALDVLPGVRLFRGLASGQLDEVAAAARHLTKNSGQRFFAQGDPACRLFVMLRGRVKISQITPEGHQIVVRYAGAGETFGCVSLCGAREYPATGEAVTPSEALSWNREEMDGLMKRNSIIAVNALQVLGRELLEIRSRYQELATERVERRIARALLRLVRQAGRKVDTGVLIDFPVSRQDLGEMTGTTLHTVSRILSGWEQKAIIASGRRRIVIRQPHALVSIAEDLGGEPS
jgi:CRP/FNR family transcriptional regulator, nitrogen oxide reductase regulator